MKYNQTLKNMNREILFRGKVIDNSVCEVLEIGDFFYGDLIQYADGKTVLIRQQETGMVLPVNPDTIEQYTGHCDINGTRIFK